MNHSEQYYSAKIFLKHYGQALTTLQLCSKYNGLEKQYKQAKQGRSERYLKATEFADNLITRYLPNFRGANNFSQLQSQIVKGVQLIKRDVK